MLVTDEGRDSGLVHESHSGTEFLRGEGADFKLQFLAERADVGTGCHAKLAAFG